jgi:hypothetical protein
MIVGWSLFVPIVHGIGGGVKRLEVVTGGGR